MLTDDGKHLYVSWDEYHMLIERLALKVANSGDAHYQSDGAAAETAAAALLTA